MALARVTSVLAQVIIRALGDSGGTLRRDVESELDNIISWAKVSPRCIHRNFTEVGNSGTGLDPLMSFTIPAGTLAVDGDFLFIHGAGNFNANDDNKRLVTLWNATAFFDTGLADFDTFGWQVQWIIARQSATTIASSVLGVLGNVAIDSAGGITSNGANTRTAYVNAFAANNLNSNTNSITFQGESATATNNNITQNILIVSVTQQ